MSVRGMSLVVAVLLVVCAACASAQEKLGDLVSEGGYEWIIGRWVATTDEGQTVYFQYDWGLDKRVVLVDLGMGGFQYRGLVMFAPARQEIFEVGADSRGGIWKGTWQEESGDLVHRVEHTGVSGEVNKGEIVYSRGDADTMTVGIYAVDGSGFRSAEPWSKLTYKRQAARTAGDGAPGEQSGRARDYESLGDLVSQGGYEWLIGRWVATNEGRTYELEHTPVLDRHAALVNVKIGAFEYRGMILYTPATQEIAQVGADNRDRTWKGTWQEDPDGIAHRVEFTLPGGTTQKIELVYIKIDNDTLRTKEYVVGADGSREATPRDELTFKRQKPQGSGTE